MQVQALPGFREFYPDETALRNHIFNAWRTVAARYGFQEYDGPPLEPLDLYTQKSGEEIVRQLYEFTDKGDRRVALRPEMTPTLARMVGARARALKKPIRWFSIPQLFRYERQQKGRLREHFQLNMDIIGESSPLVDAEIVAAAIDIMRFLGLTSEDVRVRMSHREVISKALTAQVGLAEDELLGVLAALDKYERDRKDAVHIVETVLKGDTKKIERAIHFADSLGGVAVAVADRLWLDQTIEHLDAMGLAGFVEVDFRIVRGLAYYTGMVFELFDAGKTLRAICGGGRYDNLVGQLTGVDVPCVGFGMGDVVLGQLLRDRGLVPDMTQRLDAYLIAVSGEDERFVLRLAHDLRDQGARIEYGLRASAVRKQLETAAAHGARYAVLVGPAERQSGAAKVRNMATGDEEVVAVSSLLDRIRV